MLNIVLIRHFATEGNLEKRYIGVTDEPLCEKGKQKFERMNYPIVEAVFTSPLIRCVETAKMIYPKHLPIIYKGFSEIDFGDFENKNSMELAYNPQYQKWIDSYGTLPFPNGEAVEDFKARSLAAFHEVVKRSMDNNYKTIALVVHGGTIMSILDKYSHPQEEYYHWQVENGNGFIVELEEKEWRLTNICNILSLP